MSTKPEADPIDPTKQALYTGSENVPTVNYNDSGLDQAAQLTEAIDLAYCQPDVGAFFNFLLEDEPSLAGWQSGVLWPDATPKPAYATLKTDIASVKTHSINC